MEMRGVRIIGVALSLAFAGVAPLAARHALGENPKHEAKVSLEAAQRLALEKVPGKVLDHELEKEKGRWIYSFEIEPTGGNPNEIKEVNIDADTAELVGIETEKKSQAKHEDEADEDHEHGGKDKD